LSRPTIERSISELQSIGSIRKEGNKISIDPKKNKLYLLAKLIKTEKERGNIESYAEIIYQDVFKTLKRVPKGKLAQGELTGFSLYSEYGIEYHTIHDYYYSNHNESLKLEDILIHSILAIIKDGDKLGMAMALLFYIKNKSKMDPLALRNFARKYNISQVWIDMEGYIRNIPVRKPELFLPWEEFEEKAKLYDIRTENYTLPVSYPNLFDDIGKVADPSTEAYLFGGENMRLKGLKPRTKDCDIVVSDEKSFNSVVKGLKSMGYKSANESHLSQDDLRIGASDILQHPTRSRVDIFKA
jgi:hypothetical protein